jgi:hypothetical protein
VADGSGRGATQSPPSHPRLYVAALSLSAFAALTTLVSAVLGLAVAGGASTAQVAAFVVTGISSLVGIAAGLAAALLAGHGKRRRGLRWAGANVLVGLAGFALTLLAGLHNMDS